MSDSPEEPTQENRRKKRPIGKWGKTVINPGELFRSKRIPHQKN